MRGKRGGCDVGHDVVSAVLAHCQRRFVTLRTSEQEFAVCVLTRCNGDTGKTEYFMIQRGSAALDLKTNAAKKRRPRAALGDGKLLHGQWDFPNLPISGANFESKTQQLYKELGVNPGDDGVKRRRIQKAVVHVFSHVKYTLHLNATHLPPRANGPLGGGGHAVANRPLTGVLGQCTGMFFVVSTRIGAWATMTCLLGQTI